MQLRLGDDPASAREKVEAEAQRIADDGFVCDVFHICPEYPDNGGYGCMDAHGHPLEGEHLFGCGSCGLVDLAWPSATLTKVDRCDLASSPDHGYTLVPNHLVRAYPLDVEQDEREHRRWQEAAAAWPATQAEAAASMPNPVPGVDELEAEDERPECSLDEE